MPRPKPEVEPIQITLRLSPTLLDRIDAEAAASKRSRNGVISDAIVFHIAEQNGHRHGRAREAVEEALQNDPEAEAAWFAGRPFRAEK